MKLSQYQKYFKKTWAETPDDGTLSICPAEDPGDGSASLAKGFPKETMTPIAAGGKPPRGDQFNGIFNKLSVAAQAHELGTCPAWDPDFAQAVGGYPMTAQVTIVKGGVPDILISISDNNLDNPNDPKQVNWVSVKKGLQTSGNYQPAGNYVCQNDPSLPVDKNGNIGIQWLGYRPADGTLRINVKDNKGGDLYYPYIGVPVGSIVMISSYNVPEGWLQLAGQVFDRGMYPALFKLLGTDWLPDYRGRFPRGCGGGWIGVPGIGSYQGDTIRNITGWVGNVTFYYNDQGRGGVLDVDNKDWGARANGGGDTGYRGNMTFDASRVVPTDWENRPLSVISNFIIKAI